MASKLLIKKRGLIKAKLTRIKGYVDTFVEGSDITQLRLRSERLPFIWQEYDEIQLQIELEDEEDHESDRVNFESTYYDVFSEITRILEGGVDASLGQSQISQSRHSSEHSIPRVKLPCIKLPCFNGKVTEFKHFYDTFNSLVIKNDAVDDIQRYHYLLSSLTGEAHRLIENLPVTANNFKVAWDLICKRYNNPKLIATAHMKNLFSLSTMNKDSVNDLRALLNNLVSNYNALKSLQLETPLHEVLLSQLLLEKLDEHTSKEWEVKTNDQQFPGLDELVEFLETRCRALELLTFNQRPKEVITDSKQCERYKQAKNTKQVYAATNNQCSFCRQDHPIHKCPQFIQSSVPQRREFVKVNNLCFNCLQSSHRINSCRSTNCRSCGQKHNTLLHRDYRETNNSPHQQYTSHRKQADSSTDASRNVTVGQPSNTMTYCSLENKPQAQVLLSTALVKIRGSDGNLNTCRALLDSCSQAHFVTEALVQRLGLRKTRKYVPIQGISTLKSTVKYSVTLQIHSRVNHYHTSLECLVLPKISGNLPSSHISITDWNIPEELPLADPGFNHPGKFDLLIGAEVFFHILKPGKQVRPGPYPVLQDSELGWILAGRFESPLPGNVHPEPLESFIVSRCTDLDDQLRRFWEIEELDQKPVTKEEKDCEEHFVKNTVRDHTGRFIVRLPFRQDPAKLGESHQIAMSRLLHLKGRLNRNLNLKIEYDKFLDEYEALGHMQVVNDSEEDASSSYYIPHHHVQKESSTTTKTRVVFDASAKTTNGLSLNDMLMVGPTVQEDLHSIIIRFRTHPVAFTADIEKMYRQIRIDHRDCRFQRILWKKEDEHQVKSYELQTVTYGTSSAPFLATRCLQQLAREEIQSYPKAAEILLRDFYVDDCISGCQNLKEGLDIQEQLQLLLQSGGFHLRKWSSNNPSLLSAIPIDLREKQFPLQLDINEQVKTLGLLWHPGLDHFQILRTVNNVIESKLYNHPTKRLVLATIASIFDPLGLISPIVILGKILLQRMWLVKLNWDEVLPANLLHHWQHWYGQLHHIDSIRIDRQVITKGSLKDVQLHGFSDASEEAYGACIYIRSTNEEGHTAVKLLCAKSKVAPVKKLSIPRLELCGALLLSRMYSKVKGALNINVSKYVLWTDSTVVLTWIAASPTRWKTFVANRVSEIQENATASNWRHISSKDNPADIISRGASGDTLSRCSLWWNGPTWMLQESSTWPANQTPPTTDNIPEERKTKTTLLTFTLEDITIRFSSFKRLQRVIAFISRFSFNARCQRAQRKDGSLTVHELQNALHMCIRMAQTMEYATEIADLQSKSSINNKSKLKTLNPFLCQDRILRVGGRLQASQLPFDQKHQAILPSKHHITKLIIQEEHKRLLHGGCQLVHASLRQRYWILNGKSIIKWVIHNCFICYKLKAETAKQLMGQLPHYRVQPNRPFLNTGVDYAGPFLIKSGSRRSKTKIKCYVSVFICLATKAIHLELVSDMTSQAFIAALRRLISRRGKCANIYSDNGTNFVGADREIRELGGSFKSIQQSSHVTDYSVQEGIQWHFIPARAPHFGGIWEAGVKSVKHHLRRVMGTSCLTFEELTTILTQIEACLNSRPLMPLSNDPNDPLPLTPGHFLIGTPITCLPEPDLSNTRIGLLSRWYQQQQRVQQFWKSWSNDYLTHLQQRVKWSASSPNVQPGMVVIIKEDNTPPMTWKLAVIEEVHPGVDGLVRVATIRNSQGVFKRPITRLCPLPSQDVKKEL